jgi:hypothetical protein
VFYRQHHDIQVLCKQKNFGTTGICNNFSLHTSIKFLLSLTLTLYSYIWHLSCLICGINFFSFCAVKFLLVYFTINVFWDMVLCSLVDVHWHFRGMSVNIYEVCGITSEETVMLFIVIPVRTLTLTVCIWLTTIAKVLLPTLLVPTSKDTIQNVFIQFILIINILIWSNFVIVVVVLIL